MADGRGVEVVWRKVLDYVRIITVYVIDWNPMKKVPDMPCEFCEGIVRDRQVRDDYWSGDNLIIIENVPVGVCDRCGERYYSAAVLEKMDRIAGRRLKIKRTIKVPVTSFETSA